MPERKAPFPYDPYSFLPEVPSFELTSADVGEGVTIGAPHTSKAFGLPGGEDRSPQLSWSGFPAATRSFALTCLDPDAPTGAGFWHWAVADIPLGVTRLPAGAGFPNSADVPKEAVTLRNDAGFAGFLGSAPPEGHGPHRYVFTVHALDVESLDLGPDTTPAVLGFNLFFHTLARARLTPVFGR
jgi:Raf kinase inhibitor-like YbhB/YbcL family protein